MRKSYPNLSLSASLCYQVEGRLTSGEDVETDLTTDRVSEAEMTEFLLEGSNHGCSDLVFLLVSQKHGLQVGDDSHCRTFQSRFAPECFFISLLPE